MLLSPYPHHNFAVQPLYVCVILTPMWLPTLILTSPWVHRQNGALQILGSGHQMQDMIVATLIGMLEWRKHNNKVWIILLAALPV